MTIKWNRVGDVRNSDCGKFRIEKEGSRFTMSARKGRRFSIQHRGTLTSCLQQAESVASAPTGPAESPSIDTIAKNVMRRADQGDGFIVVQSVMQNNKSTRRLIRKKLVAAGRRDLVLATIPRVNESRLNCLAATA